MILGFEEKVDTDCADVAAWRQSIVNHFYWCAATTPDGDREVMNTNWSMLPLRIQDYVENTHYPECGLGELEEKSRNRLRLEPGNHTQSREKLKIKITLIDKGPVIKYRGVGYEKLGVTSF